MENQLIRGLIFIILVFLVTSDLKELFSGIAASSSLTAFLSSSTTASSGRRGQSQSSHQRAKRHAAATDSRKTVPAGDDDTNDVADTVERAKLKLKTIAAGNKQGEDADDAEQNSHSDLNDNDALDSVQRLNNRGQAIYAKKKVMKLNEDEKKELLAMKTQLTSVLQEWCLPKLVCELHATERGSLTEAEKGLLSLIRETSLGTMGEVVSRYHFAAHMGQLISGVDGNGCHNFYPNCPLSGSRVLQMMKKARIS